jgi:hypothetical protein
MSKPSPQPMPRERLLAHGRCCGNKCYHCPYIPVHTAGSTKVS